MINKMDVYRMLQHDNNKEVGKVDYALFKAREMRVFDGSIPSVVYSVSFLIEYQHSMNGTEQKHAIY
jgi:hypothetical protein